MRSNVESLLVQLILSLCLGCGPSISYVIYPSSITFHRKSMYPVASSLDRRARFCVHEKDDDTMAEPFNGFGNTTEYSLFESGKKEEEMDLSSSSSSSTLLSVILLNVVAVIWGTQHAVIKTVVTDGSTSAFTLARFTLAALSVFPYLPTFSRDSKTEEVSGAWRWGAELGLWMFLGYAFQAIGLNFTTAQRSGFLLYLNVKFVPFFAYLLLRRNISYATWASALVALTGTALLAFDPGSGASGDSLGLNIGDAWSIAAAAASAMFILRMEAAAENTTDSASLNAACLWTVAGLAFVWCALAGSSSDGWFLQSTLDVLRRHPVALVYLGVVSTAVANYAQTVGQREVSAERASIFYAMDPVYGAFFANLLLGETIDGVSGLVGAGLITAAAATNAFLDLGSKAKQQPQLEAKVNGNIDDSLEVARSTTTKTIGND